MASNREKAAILARLEDAEGHLGPEIVLNEARNPESPLHGDFEWDDTEAAERFRLIQAARLIRTVRLAVTVSNIPLTVPNYVRDLSAETAGYRNILRVRSETDIARATVLDAMQRVSNAVKRAKTLAAVLGVDGEIGTIDELARSIMGRINLDDHPPQGEA